MLDHLASSPRVCVLLLACVAASARPDPASAQVLESVGSRALGMGGAFVAVASDSSATWWNPGGLATGPLLEVALAHTVGDTPESLPARRDRVTSLVLGVPPLGISYYRLRVTDIRLFGPTEARSGNRQTRGAGVQVRSWSADQFGVTVLHTLTSGVHVGATVKYLRGAVGGAVEPDSLPASALLAQGDALERGKAESRVDMDIGVLAVVGPVRLGGVVRNVGEPGFGDGEFVLPRQVRVGAAFDAERAGRAPLTLAVDADVRTYDTATGPRRVVAVGAERWLLARRLALRGGGRLNTAGGRGASITGGLSVAIRSGLFLDGHAVRSGSTEEEGWGAAMRMSF